MLKVDRNWPIRKEVGDWYDDGPTNKYSIELPLKQGERRIYFTCANKIEREKGAYLVATSTIMV